MMELILFEEFFGVGYCWLWLGFYLVVVFLDVADWWKMGLILMRVKGIIVLNWYLLTIR